MLSDLPSYQSILHKQVIEWDEKNSKDKHCRSAGSSDSTLNKDFSSTAKHQKELKKDQQNCEEGMYFTYAGIKLW